MLTSFRTYLGLDIPKRALALFFDTMAVQLHAGRSIADALGDAAACSGDGELRGICAAVSPAVRNGASLCPSLRPWEGRFPAIVLPLLEVGEISGSLAGSAQRLADTFQLSAGAEREMKLNAYDPRLALLGLCLLQAYVLIISALALPQQREQPLGLTAIGIAAQLAVFALEVSGAYLVARAVLRRLYRWQAVRVWVDTIKLALPQLGPISRQ